MRRIDLRTANVARSNTVRGINRQIVLNFVREKGPISRAEIARETRLQRSTISLIVDELKEFALIKEIDGESTGGRPPALLTLRSADPVAIGIDLGTSKTTVATCDLTGRTITKDVFWTDLDADTTSRMVIESIKRLREGSGKSVEGIGISLPALVDATHGRILYNPHLKWQNPGIIEKIRSATGLPVTIDNDANAAALAELWFGRPEIQGIRDFILVYIENGIGTGLVLDGQIYRGKGGVAGEFGHMTLGSDAPIRCANGNNDCWEAFASERSALARYAKMLGNSEFASRVSFVELVGQAYEGDENALAALRETARYIGIGMGNLIQGLSPEAIIVGGTITKAWSLISGDVITAAYGGVCQGTPITKIIPSTLGAEPTLLGAFSLVLADKFASISI